MIAGIMGMMEVANSLNKNVNNLDKNPEVQQYNFEGIAGAQAADQIFLKTLQSANSDWGEKEDFCKKLREETAKTGLLPSASLYSTELNKNLSSRHEKLRNPCVLSKGDHRIIISTDNTGDNDYNYFSCILRVEPLCSFEEESE